MQKISVETRGRFDLDRLNKFSYSMQKLALTNKEITKRINEAKKEFGKDGAAHVWSTFKIGDINNTMNDERGKMIIDYLDGKFIVEIKFIVKTDSAWIIRDKRDSLRRSGDNIVISKKT